MFFIVTKFFYIFFLFLSYFVLIGWVLLLRSCGRMNIFLTDHRRFRPQISHCLPGYDKIRVVGVVYFENFLAVIFKFSRAFLKNGRVDATDIYHRSAPLFWKVKGWHYSYCPKRFMTDLEGVKWTLDWVETNIHFLILCERTRRMLWKVESLCDHYYLSNWYGVHFESDWHLFDEFRLLRELFSTFFPCHSLWQQFFPWDGAPSMNELSKYFGIRYFIEHSLTTGFLMFFEKYWKKGKYIKLKVVGNCLISWNLLFKVTNIYFCNNVCICFFLYWIFKAIFVF